VPGGRSPDERDAARRARNARRGIDTDGGAPPVEDWMAEARRLTEEQSPVPGPGPPGGPRWGRIVAALIVALVLGGAAWFLLSLFQPFKGDDGGDRLRVSIPKGIGVGQIGDLLEQRGVIASSFFFQARARLDGSSGDLKPGSYVLRKDMGYGAALAALKKGTPPNIVTVTIPEGPSRGEVAKLIPKSLTGSYAAATRRSRALDPREYGAKAASSLEGFLFPATYELKKGRPVGALVEAQLSTFRQKFETIDTRAARKKNLTPYDVLIIASLVEREASVPKDRPLIASVIYNRLKQGMTLGIDATVRYATGNYSRPLRQSELQSSSPYNTRNHQGLPPGPIGNPGLASIQAAAHPARTSFLFFVVKPCGRGEHVFSSTDAQFQRDSQRYDAERIRQGKSPVKC
jgi:peptidoglycan lytic transglycosylase G